MMIVEKTKAELLSARKSQDISHVLEPEKAPSKKSIYLKAAEFLLNYNIATVRDLLLLRSSGNSRALISGPRKRLHTSS